MSFIKQTYCNLKGNIVCRFKNFGTYCVKYCMINNKDNYCGFPFICILTKIEQSLVPELGCNRNCSFALGKSIKVLKQRQSKTLFVDSLVCKHNSLKISDFTHLNIISKHFKH